MKRFFYSSTLIIAAIAFVIGMQSCKSVEKINKSQLVGNWVLKSLNGEAAQDGFKGQIPYLSFDFEKGTIAGNAGCNNFNGGFTLTENNEFTASKVATTMMMCIHDNKEPQFLSALSTPNLIVSIDKEGQLNLSQDKSVVLQFAKGEIPKAEGGVTRVNAETLAATWTLTSFTGEDVAKLYTGKVPTIVFAADGKVSGNGGCNSYRGTYTLEENTVTFGPLMSTKMACPSLDGETKFTQALSSPLQATINGNTLVFLKEGEVVMQFSKATAE